MVIEFVAFTNQRELQIEDLILGLAAKLKKQLALQSLAA